MRSEEAQIGKRVKVRKDVRRSPRPAPEPAREGPHPR